MSWKENAKKDPLDRNICICKQVTRRTLINAVDTQQLTDIAVVRDITGANTGCGACQEAIETLLTKAIAGEY